MPDFDLFKDSLTLEKGKTNREHDALLERVRKLVGISRRDMGKFYTTWDYHDQIFRSNRTPDREDENAKSKGQPAKLIVPLAMSQTMTFVAFATQTVLQNKRFFELEYEGAKDPILKEPLELILERDVRRNKWSAFLVQFFLDCGRFWLGCAEVCYKEEYRNMRVVTQIQTPGIAGIPETKSESSYIPIPTFVGNRVYPVSPYRFFPDTRLPLTRFQEGEFCASEDMFSMSSLRADSDNLFNLDKIPKMSEKDYKARRESSRIDEMDFIPHRATQDSSTSESSEMVTDGAVVITKIVCDIIPNNFEIDGKKVLGTDKFPLRYIVWYANDKTVIRFEEAYYLHGQFPYICAQYLPDQQKTVNEGLSAMCDQITNLITWKLNAHLKSQRNSVRSKYVVDPAGIDTKNLDTDNPFMYLRKNASQTGVDRYIKQFITQDVTANVMSDVNDLKNLLESITGISGAMQGQYSSGRRSATQDRVVAQGASARAKTTLSSIWDEAFEPLGKQLLANNRSEMDLETFSAIVGPGPFGPMQDVTVDDLYAKFHADPITIATSEDFFVFDGTTPSEKAYLAQSLQEVFMMILQNPMIAQVLGYGPEQIRYLMDEIYELRGVTPPYLPPATPQQQLQAPTVMPPPEESPVPAAPPAA